MKVEAEHRAPRGRQRPLRRRLGRADRQDRLLHGLQDHLPVPAPGARRPGGERDADLPARLPPRPPRARVHRTAAAARRDHADRRGPVRVGRRPDRGQVGAPRSRGDGARDRARRRQDAQALRRLAAPHDPGRLLSVPADRRARAQARASARGDARRRTPPPRPGAPASPHEPRAVGSRGRVAHEGPRVRRRARHPGRARARRRGRARRRRTDAPLQQEAKERGALGARAARGHRRRWALVHGLRLRQRDRRALRARDDRARHPLGPGRDDAQPLRLRRADASAGCARWSTARSTPRSG